MTCGRCHERREALLRARAFEASGDAESARREREWVWQSLIEDSKKMVRSGIRLVDASWLQSRLKRK